MVSPSLRILLTTPDYKSPGGIQTLTRNLERGLEALDQTVDVLHIPPDGDYPLTSYLPRLGWCNSVSDVRTGRWPYRHTVYSRTADRITTFDPDIIHALHIQHYPALRRAKESGIPSVVSTHALELEDNVATREAVAEASRIHAVSDFTAGLVRDISSPLPEHNLYTVPPSIDLESFTRSDDDSSNVPPSDAPVVTLSRLEEGYKNIGTIIRAWERLADPITSNRKLIIAGDGPQRDSLERIARSIDGVQFTGYLSEAEKRQLLQRAGVFTFVPGRDGYGVEGFGIVYIEAQAAGTPVVGSRHGGAPEAIGDGGLIVDDESDPSAVADAIETLLVDESTRRSCLQAIDDRIHEFGIEPVATAHLDVYADLV